MSNTEHFLSTLEELGLIVARRASDDLFNFSQVLKNSGDNNLSKVQAHRLKTIMGTKG